MKAGAVREITRTVYVTRAQGAVSTAAAAKDATTQTDIRWRTKTIVHEVPTYVTPEIDARYLVPVGLERVHDAAALGRPISGLPDAAGRPDDAASNFTASQLGERIAANYGECIADQARLTQLQAWIMAQSAAFATKP